MWLDEAQTALIVERPGLGEMLEAYGGESAPPLYYLVVWAWAKLAGHGDYSLRMVAALAGTATVLVTYLVGMRLSGRRAALIAAAMVATSPYLIHYSQENRPYSALSLAAVGTLLLFLRARERRSAGALTAWGAAAIAALAVHYFAAFFLLPQAVMLLRGAIDRRRLLKLLAPGAALSVGLVVLALNQLADGSTDWIGTQPLDNRLLVTFHLFTKGAIAVPGAGLGLAAVLLLVAGAVLLARADSDERRSASLPLALAASGLILPLVLVPLGLDLVTDRNLIGVWPLLALALAIGFASRPAGRVGVIAATALCVVWAATSVALQSSAAHRREDWRGAAEFLATSPQPRVVAVSPGYSLAPLLRYRPRLVPTAPRGTRVTEVAVVAAPAPPAGWPRIIPWLPSFRRAATWDGERIGAATYRAAAPQPLPPLPRPGLYIEPGDPR